MTPDDMDKRLLTLVIDVVTGKTEFDDTLRQYRSDDYDATEELEGVTPQNLTGEYTFLIDAMNVWLDHVALIWSNEYEIDLRENSDEPEMYEETTCYLQGINEALNDQINNGILVEPIEILTDYATNGLLYAKLKYTK